VNIEPREIDAALDLSALGVGPEARVQVVFENRDLSLRNGLLRDRFKAHDRHVYRVVP